jgi:hypothetical protein
MRPQRYFVPGAQQIARHRVTHDSKSQKTQLRHSKFSSVE